MPYFNIHYIHYYLISLYNTLQSESVVAKDHLRPKSYSEVLLWHIFMYIAMYNLLVKCSNKWCMCTGQTRKMPSWVKSCAVLQYKLHSHYLWWWKCWDLFSCPSCPGSLLVQCSADGSPHHGWLCVPSLGTGGWLVHGPLLHDPHPWLHGLHVPYTQRHIQRGKISVDSVW